MYLTRTMIAVRKLRIDRVQIGVYPEEQNKPSPVVIDAFCQIKTIVSDELHATLDYTQMQRTIETVAKKGHFNLIETMAREIAVAISELSTFIEKTTVRVRKPRALSRGIAEARISVLKR